MKIIGLDVGEKRIGVAKADSKVRIAVPVGFLLADGSEWQEIARIARLNGTNLFVLGLPRSNEGNETAQSQYVRQFASKLAKNVPGAKIQFQDESLTSVLAEERLKKRRKNYEKGEIDAEAATIILQDFLEKVTQKTEDKPQKAKGRIKIITAVVISVVALGLIGTTAILKYRDYVRWQREEYYKEQEAQMKAEVFNFTIAPGSTIFDVKKNLLAVKRGENTPNYTPEEVEAAFAADYDFEFLASRPAGASLEGYLFPETYEFYATDTVETILKRFLEGMGEVIAENRLAEKYAEHRLSLHEGIILASVVQEESVSNPSDQATVAQVFYSRLNYGWTLGSDSTVTYALDVLDPNREIYQDNAAALLIDSCYNTRRFTGLPCGAIANPGLSALLAVAAPSDTAYLFFLTGDDGLMYYSNTEAEHIQNTRLHCQVLCNISL